MGRYKVFTLLLFSMQLLGLGAAKKNVFRGRHERQPKQSFRITCAVDNVCSGLTGAHFDNLVIGAGFSGLGAAVEIQRYNEAHPASARRSFKILEGDFRVGGRAIAGHYASGGEGNPILELFWKHFGNDFLHHEQNWASVRYDDGLTQRQRQNTRREFSAAFSCAQDVARGFDWTTCPDGADDPGWYATLTDTCGWTPSDDSVLGRARFLMEW